LSIQFGANQGYMTNASRSLNQLQLIIQTMSHWLHSLQVPI